MISTYRSHDRTGPDNCALSNVHTSKDGDIAANEHIIGNGDSTSLQSTVHTVALHGVRGWSRCEEGHVRSDRHTVANADRHGVGEVAVAANVDGVTDGDVVAVVRMERRIHDNLVANRTHGRLQIGATRLNNFLKQACTLALRDANVRVRRVVELPAGRSTALPEIHQLVVELVERASCVHLVLLASRARNSAEEGNIASRSDPRFLCLLAVFRLFAALLLLLLTWRKRLR